jgi:uncharacterized protein (DUF58 family)
MLTLRGAIILGSALALLTVGVVAIDGILISLGLSGLLLLVCALILSRRNLRHLLLEVRAPTRVYAEAPFDLRLTLHNKRALLDAFRVHARLDLSQHAKLHTDALWTATRSSSLVQVRGSIPNRGAVTSHPFTLRSTFPLDLFQSTASGSTTHEILVYPRPVTPREFFTHGALHDASILPGTTPGNAPGEPRGIRPWQPGDPAKHIHWPASARSLSRRQGLRIRENDPPGFHPHHCTIVFHSYGTTGELIRSDRFERALSLACGTLHYLRQHGIPATLVADFLDWAPLATTSRGAFSDALCALARAERSSGTEAHNLASALETIPPNNSLILLSDMPPSAWASALPKRPALVVDIRQHKRRPAPLNTTRSESHA